jgi:hypothetical protein
MTEDTPNGGRSKTSLEPPPPHKPLTKDELRKSREIQARAELTLLRMRIEGNTPKGELLTALIASHGRLVDELTVQNESKRDGGDGSP